MFGDDFDQQNSNMLGNNNPDHKTLSDKDREEVDEQEFSSSESSVDSVSLDASQERVLRKKLGWKEENND